MMWSLYFLWHGKHCTWCERYTETTDYDGDNETVQVCDDCIDELCNLCFRAEGQHEQPDGYYWCTDCYSAQIDLTYERVFNQY